MRESEAQRVQVDKEVQRRPPMPYLSLNAMSEPDVRAIYRYVPSLGSAAVPAPRIPPPDQVPPKPYLQFPTTPK